MAESFQVPSADRLDYGDRNSPELNVGRLLRPVRNIYLLANPRAMLGVVHFRVI